MNAMLSTWSHQKPSNIQSNHVQFTNKTNIDQWMSTVLEMEFDIIPPTDWDQTYHADSASDESSDSVVGDTY